MTASVPSPSARFSWLRPWPATHLLILGSALLHLAAAASMPLVHFEAHYALYGLHLDWSYLDHPPMVGWIQALALPFSNSDLAMRLAPILLTAASQYLLAALALRLYPSASPWLGFITVLLLKGAPITHASMAMTPEAPLLLTGLLVVWFTHVALTDNRRRDWLGLGLALGLAGLSKYTGVILALSVPLALLISQRLSLLRQTPPWLAVAIAALLVSPVLIWNYLNDWASFTFQYGYQIAGGRYGPGWSARDALYAHLQQALAYSPALYLGGIAATVWGLWRYQPSNGLLLVFAWPILLLFTYQAGASRSTFHWTLLVWVFLAPMTALWIMRQWRRSRAVRYLVLASGSLSLLALLMVLLVLPPAMPFPDYGHPLSRALGSQAASARAEALRRQWASELRSEAQIAVEEPVLLVTNWHYASQLAWYGYPGTVQDTARRVSQNRRWYGSVGPETRGILVVFDERDERPKPGVPGFECSEVDTLPVYRGTALARMFYFFRCEAAGDDGAGGDFD